MEWIKSEDQLPFENNDYLCFCSQIYLFQKISRFSDAYFIAYFSDGKWSSREKYNCEMITHWTLLPRMP